MPVPEKKILVGKLLQNLVIDSRQQYALYLKTMHHLAIWWQRD